MAASYRDLDVASLVALAFVLVACGGHETTASRSAAAYDEAQRKGTPVEKSAAHGGHAAPATEKQASTSAADPHAEHRVSAPSTNSNPAGMHHVHAASKHPPTAGMDHSRMAGEDHGQKAGSGSHEQHAPAGVGHPELPGHSNPADADHAAMGHGAPMPPPVPEPSAASAQPGQPAATLRADEIDAPAETSLRDAERAAAMSKEMAGRHGMEHGTPYRQLDAGRDSASPTPRPSPHRHQGN